MLGICRKKGWVGIRKLRKYFKSLNRKNNSHQLISKVDFKYFSANIGLFFDDKEIEYIFEKYDHTNKNQINYNEFLNSYQCIQQHRKELILRFFYQQKNNKNFVPYKQLEDSIIPELHPEVYKIFLYSMN